MNAGRIFVEQAKVLVSKSFADGQFMLKLIAPKCAAAACPGNFVYLQCCPNLLLRRPFSIQAVSVEAGWIEVFGRIVGRGTQELAQQQIGALLSCMGPIGNHFAVGTGHRHLLLLGGGLGLPPLMFLAQNRHHDSCIKITFFIGYERSFPFPVSKSSCSMNGIPDEVNLQVNTLSDEFNIPNRLCSMQGKEGFYLGAVDDLAEQWLRALPDRERSDIAVYACGPRLMLKAVSALCVRYALPGQIAVEEHMACAVGGCYGCVVPVLHEGGTVMRRVCVDGPVFNAADIIFP